MPLAANAVPSGIVTRDAFEAMAGRIVDGVKGGCDAVMLDLHGAMVADGFDDAEGELLRRIRAVAPESADRRRARFPRATSATP